MGKLGCLSMQLAHYCFKLPLSAFRLSGHGLAIPCHPEAKYTSMDTTQAPQPSWQLEAASPQ
jgi:hypothetical protein